MTKYDYIGAFTDNTIDHALIRGLRATSYIRADILEHACELSPAERALADDAVAAINEANSRIGRLTYLLMPNSLYRKTEEGKCKHVWPAGIPCGGSKMRHDTDTQCGLTTFHPSGMCHHHRIADPQAKNKNS